MTEWWQDPKLWVIAIGWIAQTAVNQWRVNAQEVRIAALEKDVDSLREYRAQVREQIRQLQNGRRDDDR